MSHRRSPLVCLGACLVFLVSGALNRQLLLSYQSGGIPSQPLTAPSADFRPVEETPTAFWTRLLAAWDPGRVHWLDIRTRQRMHLGEAPFMADNRLVLGPNGCARRSSEVKSARGVGRVLVVCDGKILAESRTFEQEVPVLFSEAFGPGADPAIARAKLQEKACIGPHAAFSHLKTRVQEARLTAGDLEGRAILCLLGKVPAPPLDPDAPRELFAHRQVRLLVERDSLLPVRLEWWLEGPDGQASRLLLEVDYLEVKKGQPLSREECIRQFSFTPDLR